MADARYSDLKQVGIGSIEQRDIEGGSLLDDASELEYIGITNPLPMKFIGQVAQSRPISAPIRITNGERFGVDENTLKASGLGLRNPDVVAKTHVTIAVEIDPGETKNLRGDEAKVILRQLTSEVMNYNGQTNFLANPTARRTVEKTLIVARRSVDDLIGSVANRDQLIEEALKKTNVEKPEEAFPDLKKGTPTKATEPES